MYRLCKFFKNIIKNSDFSRQTPLYIIYSGSSQLRFKSREHLDFLIPFLNSEYSLVICPITVQFTIMECSAQLLSYIPENNTRRNPRVIKVSKIEDTKMPNPGESGGSSIFAAILIGSSIFIKLLSNYINNLFLFQFIFAKRVWQCSANSSLYLH